MKRYDTMAHILEDARNNDRHIRFIDGENDESTLSFASLWDQAVELLGVLQAQGVERGSELVIFTRANKRFVVAFWAAILGGIVPVPVAVGLSDEHQRKLFRILTQLQNAALMTDPDLHEKLVENNNTAGHAKIADTLRSRCVVGEQSTPGKSGEPVTDLAPDDIAFIQYSSGSTSDPKGVVLKHANLTSNIRAIVEGADWGSDDQALSWMPLTHDMGLIGFHLSVLAAGMNHAVMDTNVFIRRPLLWMQKASELQATQLCSPNFGYKHFLKLFERKGLQDIDLSAVKLILNGAEPISWELCERFLSALSSFGLERKSMFPVYGLAEATVGVSFPTVGVEYGRIIVDRHGLQIGKPYRVCNADHADALSLVKVGRAIRDCEIRITDDDDRSLPDGHVGHIQIRGENVTDGIYHDPDTTQSIFTADRWLRSGDVGVVADGQLVITGRSKDIIIVNGQNYYPHDIEDIVCRLEGLELGKVVVCGVSGSGEEEVLVFILFRQSVNDFVDVAAAVKNLVAEESGIAVSHVLPVSRIPKTTSGKVQRAQLASDYLNGKFSEAKTALTSAATAADGGSEVAANEDPLVSELMTICREFSKERKIGADDNLFEVGISSLTLTEIVLAIDERYPGKVDISDLFDYPTLREIATFMRQE